VIRSTFDREIAALAVPALAALAADPLVSLVDTAFVGRLGASELAALAVSTAVFSVAFFIFNFLAYATTPMVAGALGRGDPAEAGRVVAAALAVAVAGGAATVLVVEALAGPILTVMGAGSDVIADATTYLRIRALAIPAVLIALVGHGAFRGHHDTRTPLRVTIGLNVVNLILDPLLIFTAGMGIAGAAWATVAAQWMGAVWFLALLRRARGGVAGAGWPGVAIVRRFLRAGGDLVLRTAALLGTMTLATAVAARVGTDDVAAHQIAVQLWVFLALAVDALAIAAQAMVGRYLGLGRPGEARRASNRLLVLGLGVGLLFAAGMAALAPVLSGVFTDEAAVIDRLEAVYWFVAAMQPLNAVVFVWDGIVIGTSDFRFLAVAMALAAAAAAAVLLAVVPAGWGLAGVWWGMTVLMAGRLVTLGWWHWGRRTVLRPASPA
jgi:MATE family multidrug resistance protein